MSRTLEEFSTEELSGWVATVLNKDDGQIFSSKQKRDAMKKAFSENKVNGMRLSLCHTIDDVKNMISNWRNGNDYLYLKKKLWDAIEMQRKIDELENSNEEGENEQDLMAQLIANANAQRIDRQPLSDTCSVVSNNDEESNDNEAGTIKISIDPGNGHIETLRERFRPTDTVKYLIERACELMPQLKAADNRDRKIAFMFHGKEMKQNQTLGKIGFKENSDYNPNITLLYYVNGGALAVNDNKNDVLKFDSKWDKKERIPDLQSKTGIKPSLKPDCIMGYDSKKELRIEMPCGHVFSPKTIFLLVKMYANDMAADNITCPIVDCKQKWEYDAIAAAGDFGKNEIRYFKNLFEKRALLRSGNVKECGGCGSFIALSDELGRIRVRCPRGECKYRSDFCWTCGKDWKGGGFSLCGNKNCPNMGINETLKQCEMIKPAYLDGTECPSLRACPKCLKIIRWNEQCKHITCWGCKQTFCFVCLSSKGFWGWPKTCGSHRTKCNLAARQQLKS